MKYRKRSVVIDAILWQGNLSDIEPLGEYIGELRPINNADEPVEGIEPVEGPILDLQVKTLEGWVICYYGNYLLKGVKGELYPCRADIFEMTYDRVDDE
jgi:hypothetical protein